MASPTNDRVVLEEDDEVVLQLAEGWTLRSGPEYNLENRDHNTGAYVRVCGPDGSEWLAWHHSEWRANPVGVMGEIIFALKDHLTEVREGDDTR